MKIKDNSDWSLEGKEYEVNFAGKKIDSICSVLKVLKFYSQEDIEKLRQLLVEDIDKRIKHFREWRELRAGHSNEESIRNVNTIKILEEIKQSISKRFWGGRMNEKGYEEGYNEGYNEGYGDCQEDINDAYKQGQQDALKKLKEKIMEDDRFSYRTSRNFFDLIEEDLSEVEK